MLHIVNKSPYSASALEDCLRVAGENDRALLIEDAVFAVMAGAKFAARLTDAMNRVKIYALAPDLKARAIERVVDGVELVDYAGFVELVEQDKTVSWV